MNKAVDEKRICISEEFTLVKSGLGFNVEWVSSTPHVSERGGEKKELYASRTYCYGTLYQAFQGFVRRYVEEGMEGLDDVIPLMEEAEKKLDELDGKIKDAWKIVKVVRG